MSAKKKQKLDSGEEENINPAITDSSFAPVHPEFTEWSWDVTSNPKIIFKEDGNGVVFNPSFSVGTQAVKGKSRLEPLQNHYFEILMCSEVYGTDMMIGIGTGAVNLEKYAHTFVSFLGMDKESWGLSYTGNVHHDGEFKPYTAAFKKGDRIGVHVNLWNGTLEFYLNSEPLGIAFKNLDPKGHYYPMISSTSARSGMTLTYSRSYKNSLQFNAIQLLVKNPFLHPGMLPPGLVQLIKNNFWWLNNSPKKPAAASQQPTISQPAAAAATAPSTSKNVLRRKKTTSHR